MGLFTYVMLYIKKSIKFKSLIPVTHVFIFSLTVRVHITSYLAAAFFQLTGEFVVMCKF